MITKATHTIHDRNLRGHSKIGWLDSWHTFSFSGFQDPNRMGFRSLRVINDDRVIPGAGFGTHAHRDMEILTYVLEGELAHKDSLGTGSVIRPNPTPSIFSKFGCYPIAPILPHATTKKIFP
jgi:quercetin 2,3-dioxygenase